ncbi:hypothetical protein QE400_003607 [Xanthomonas sacchari]|nr:hypothetical protein [Xanthomonas sacchari]MDQ1094194.1 hypothetical protein [Xanthomonas sacchari]
MARLLIGGEDAVARFAGAAGAASSAHALRMRWIERAQREVAADDVPI